MGGQARPNCPVADIRHRRGRVESANLRLFRLGQIGRTPGNAANLDVQHNVLSGLPCSYHVNAKPVPIVGLNNAPFRGTSKHKGHIRIIPWTRPPVSTGASMISHKSPRTITAAATMTIRSGRDLRDDATAGQTFLDLTDCWNYEPESLSAICCSALDSKLPAAVIRQRRRGVGSGRPLVPAAMRVSQRL